jgi:Domain of unknown function (DUF4331)
MARIGASPRIPWPLVIASLVCLAVAAFVALVLANGPAPPPAAASSHAEAPLIGQDPRADNTDLYAFVSPDKPDTVTIVANYIPLEAPASGPNFYSFDDSVRYEIHVVSGDTSSDDTSTETTYRFRFTTATRNPNTFLYNTGPIGSNDDPDWNRPQTYSVSRVVGSREQLLGQNIPTPPANVGPRSTPDYGTLADAAVTQLPGGIQVFAGQREDPFFVDLGSIFDLAGLRPFNNLHVIPLPVEQGRDAVANYNVHTIAIQVPISQLTQPGHPSIGVYASASRQRVRVLRSNGTSSSAGDWVQVSRLGEPLINEAVIPLGQKDFWNRTEPEDDQQFLSFYRNPEVTRLENTLYPALDDAATTGRDDLVAILLTGVQGLNFTGSQPRDLLRLNTGIAPTAAAGEGDRLGVLDGDLAGFPNGRRLEDDIVDIDLRAFAEGYGSFLHGLLGLPDRTPNDLLGDGVDANDKPFSKTFPYVAAPNQGYQVP